MKIEWMIEEVADSCCREFRGVVEDAAARGVDAIPDLEVAVLTKTLHFGAPVVSKILQGLPGRWERDVVPRIAAWLHIQRAHS